MKIAELNLSPIYFNRAQARGGLLTNGLSASNFSSMLNSIIKEDAAPKSSDTSCSCDNTEKCKCGSGNEASEVAETEKKGLAACMECSFRKSGQCELWKDKEDVFDMIKGLSNDTSTARDVSLTHERSDPQADFVRMAGEWFNYNNAYAHVSRKQLGILMPD